MKSFIFKLVLAFIVYHIHCPQSEAQTFFTHTKEADKWVKKEFKKLSKEERIAQLMIIRAHSNLGKSHIEEVTQLIQKYNVGGLCFFQGGPVRQANLTNYYQAIAKTPLMITIDAEWGLGMRLDSVISYPRQLMMGAINDVSLITDFGKAVGEQCKRMGIHVNFAPVVDVNNNALNPVINDRSFGEDKYKVSNFGIAYTMGMQSVGVMGSAKHFPGHGDVAVDSHKDLPVINKSIDQLTHLELYPFKEIIQAGVGSIMVGHLSVPAIDSTNHLPSSLSSKHINGLLKKDLGFQGLTFTDALEMQGVTKYFPDGEAAVLSLVAGNDLLCLPGNIPGSIQKIKEAIKEGKLSWEDINLRVQKILLAKYHLGLNKAVHIETEHLLSDLNARTQLLKKKIVEEAITVVRKSDPTIFPIAKGKRIAYIALGAPSENFIANYLKNHFQADIYLFGAKKWIGKELQDDKNQVNIIDQTDSSAVDKLMQEIGLKNYDLIISGLHNFSRRPANQFGISNPSLYLLTQLQGNKHINLVFGNPYALQYLSNSANLLACYEDDELTQIAAGEILTGKLTAKGRLPVTVNDSYKIGMGISYHPYMNQNQPESLGLSSKGLSKIDSIANAAIEKGAMPGCVILVARNGQIAYEKAFGYTNFDQMEPMNTQMLFDLASVTKIAATTVSVMKLFDEKKIDLDKTIGDYLPWVLGTDKAPLKIRDILLHQAGLVPFIPFYKELIDSSTGEPMPQFFSPIPTGHYNSRVAENLYLRNDWVDSIQFRIAQSKLSSPNNYVYSDNDFIFLGRIVESITGKTLHKFTQDQFYQPLQMRSTGFVPRERFPINQMVPTEWEKHFRKQLIRGDVHDEGASLFGGVAGHAGLFSNAYDLAQLFQLLLNGGSLNGIQLLEKSTIDLFTGYQSTVSRRGLGFDKPEKDNASRKDPYPSSSISPSGFGHTGFTGTCVWVDPKENLIYIFLSNRVTPSRSNNKLGSLNVRPSIQEAIYHAIQQ